MQDDYDGYDNSLLVAACSVEYRYQSFGGTQCHWLQENRGNEVFFLNLGSVGSQTQMSFNDTSMTQLCLTTHTSQELTHTHTHTQWG